MTAQKTQSPPDTLLAEPPVIFFDGICGLCNAWVDFVLVRDKRASFLFAALQGETARHRLHIAPGDPLDSVVLADRSGTYWKSDAVWRILARLGGAWSIAGYLLRIVPRPVRNWGYNFIARRRYKWFGRKETCRMPNSNERGRFLP